ncbi:hypothetical protein HUJ04_004812 [Dendroctonus ponderosae]|nr:hypothetical protein HUJ04_004812 [Dendroctonus ponderosae]
MIYLYLHLEHVLPRRMSARAFYLSFVFYFCHCLRETISVFEVDGGKAKELQRSVKLVKTREFTVVVPPEKIHIFDDKRIDKSVLLGPYNEGSDVSLLCEVRGGRPRPRVIWFLENNVIDETFANRSEEVVINHMVFPNVGRQHLHARLICQASNNNIVPPETKAVVLDINCKWADSKINSCIGLEGVSKQAFIYCRTLKLMKQHKFEAPREITNIHYENTRNNFSCIKIAFSELFSTPSISYDLKREMPPSTLSDYSVLAFGIVSDFLKGDYQN